MGAVLLWGTWFHDVCSGVLPALFARFNQEVECNVIDYARDDPIMMTTYENLRLRHNVLNTLRANTTTLEDVISTSTAPAYISNMWNSIEIDERRFNLLAERRCLRRSHVCALYTQLLSASSIPEKDSIHE